MGETITLGVLIKKLKTIRRLFCGHHRVSDLMIVNGGYSRNRAYGCWATFCDNCGKKVSKVEALSCETILENNYDNL